MLYMHASLSPFIMAENLATCVLVYESPAPEMPVRDLFPPIAEFMKTCSRLVLGTQTQNLDPRRFMLHCLLNHVTVDRPSDEFIAAYDELAAIDFCRFTRFANQSVSPALATHAQVVTAVYWNTNEALVLLANLGDVAADAHWQLDTNRLDWRTDSYHVVSGDGPSLAPLAFRYVHIVRHQISV